MRSLKWVVSTLIVPLLLAWLVARLLHAGFVGPSSQGEKVRNDFGPVELTLRLPGTHAGIAEPLVSCGRPGKATMVYLKNLRDAQAKVGVEFWGVGASQSEAFSVGTPQAVIHVTCYFPALFPPVGDRAWQGVPLEIQRIRRSRYYLVVDGVVRLTGAVEYDQGDHPVLAYGINPLGGSLVSDRLTATLISASQRTR